MYRAFLWSAVALFGCAEGQISGGRQGVANPGLEVPGTGVTAGQRKKNEDLRTALEPTCGGCHGASTNKPFFASITAFEDLLVYNSAYVVPREPDKSVLLDLLHGRAKGSFKQMPPAGPTFAALATSGKTRISIEAVAEFITSMEPRASQGVARANPHLAVPHRLTAAQVRDTLYQQLGLTRADFFHESGDTRGDDLLPVREPDDPLPDQYSRSEPTQRWISMGGAAHLELIRPNTQLTPSFFQNLAQMSQAWCRIAVEKPGSPLFPHVAKTDTSATKAPEIKLNIAALHLRMLGAPPTDAELERIFKLFLAYEAKGPETSWIAICSAFVRHPLWLSY